MWNVKKKGDYFKPYKASFIKEIPDIQDEISIDIEVPIKSSHFKTKIKHASFYILKNVKL